MSVEIGVIFRRILAGSGTFLFGSSFSKVCFLVFEIALARELGAGLFGIYSIGLAFAFVLSALCVAGLDHGVVQYLAIYGEKGRRASQARLVQVAILSVLGIGALAGGAIAAGAAAIAGVFGKPDLAQALVVVGMIVPVEAVNQCMSAAFRGLRRSRHNIVVLDLARNMVLIACLPAILLAGFGPLEVLLVFFAGSLAGMLYGLFHLFRDLNVFKVQPAEENIFRDLFGFSYPLFFWTVIQTSTHRLFVLLAGLFLTSEEVGIVAIAMRLVIALNLLQTAVNMTAPVEFARLNHIGDGKGLNELFQILSLGLLVTSVIASMPVLVEPGAILGLLGTEYAAIAWILWPLLGAKVFNVASGPLGHLLISCRRRHEVLYLSLVEAFLQFGAIVPLMWLYGLPGAVFGEAGKALIMVVLRHVVVWKQLHVRSITLPFVALLGAATGGVLVGILVANQLDGLGGYLAAVAVSWTVFAIGAGVLLSTNKGFAQRLVLAISRPKDLMHATGADRSGR